MRLWFWLICLVHFFVYAQANKGIYTVIAPGSIYSNDKYTAAVSVHHVSQPCKVNVSLSGPSYSEIKQVEVSQNEVKSVEFNTPNLEYGDYSLTAEGINCVENFKNTTELFLETKNYYVAIQTDKGLYKRGDEVKFKVVFMDRNLKPAEPLRNALIWFSDGDNKIVKEIPRKKIKTIKGVYSDKFTIPMSISTGEWVLGVVNGDSDSSVYFVVEDRYFVKVEATESVSIKDGGMQVVVTANHVSGEPVYGKVNVSITLDILKTRKPPPILTKTVDMVRGMAKIDFNVKDAYSNYTHEYRTAMNIVATVEEEWTHFVVSETTRSYNYPFRYTLSCTRKVAKMKDGSCFVFEGGKENDVLFQMMYINGSYVKDTKSSVEFTYTEVLRKDFRYNGKVAYNIPPKSENHIVSFNGHLNETGFINFKVLLPQLKEYKGYLHYYLLKYKYMGEQRPILKAYPNSEVDRKSTKYFTLTDQSLSNEKLEFNKPYQFTVNSSEHLSYFVYNVIGHRNIVESGSIDLPHKPKVYNLVLTPELSWGPKFRIYVYYVDENDEYHYAERRYNSGQLNPITVKAKSHARPGEEVSITIKSTPNSFVGLMAVDQRLLLMKKNNAFTRSQLDRIYENFGTFTPPQGGYSRYPGGISGCVTLTNGHYFYNRGQKPENKPNIGLYGDGIVYYKGTEAVSMSSSFQAVSAGDEYSTQDLWKTWLFDIEDTYMGNVIYIKKLPDTKTTWVLTAFSLNPSKGFGVTEHETTIKISA